MARGGGLSSTEGRKRSSCWKAEKRGRRVKTPKTFLFINSRKCEDHKQLQSRSGFSSTHRKQSSSEVHQERTEGRTHSYKPQTKLLRTMRPSWLLTLSFLLHVRVANGASGFRICAFNLQHFGDSKSKKSDVMQTLVRIITRCDVCLLQEVRDSRGAALPELLQQIRRFDPEHQYESVSSERLGRSDSYQEQYVFIYRSSTTTITGKYQYPDDLPGDEDAFSREPFVVRFKAPQTAVKEFVLIPQHTTPTNTTKELDALYDVLQRVRKMWRTDNVMLLGDFNADCGYLPKKNRKNVRLITDTSLSWLIPDTADTTVRSTTSCSYDRIVVHGETFNRAIVPSSAKAFNFQEEYRLTEKQALNVSDHYPVEVLLKVVQTRSNSGCGSFSMDCFILLILSHLILHLLSSS